MQCKDIEQILEQDGFSPLPEAVRGHVAGCIACSSLVADFERIVAKAHEISAEVEPPSRIWISLRAQLEAEGIMREPKAPAPVHTTLWWQGFGQLIRGRMLATATVALLLLAIVYSQFNSRSKGPVAMAPPAAPQAVDAAGTSLDQEEERLGPMQPASMSSVSSVDNSLRENLITLNAFIKECRKRLQENPHDQVARDYLSAAYQQKAEILAAMMERGRSVN
jgi:hypothetical protein